MALLLCVPLPLLAQSVTVAGRILHRGQQDRPLAGQWAVLHEIRRDSGGPVDSVRTDAAGRYRLTLPRVDTAALYVVNSTYQDVGYVSRPLPVARGGGRVEAEPLVVYDTTAAGPPVRLERRLLTLFQPGNVGARTVRELLEISNPGNQTRIASDSLNPVWKVVLPAGATALEVGEGDIAPETIWLRGDTVKVFAPIWPGAPRWTLLRYDLTGSTARISLDQWTGVLGLLVEDTTAVLSGVRVDSLGIHELDGRRFASYRAGPLEAGSELIVAFSRGTLRVEQLVPYVTGAAVLALAWGLWVALKRKPSTLTPKPSAGRKAHR
jgi:hypothetical protein